MTTPLVVAYVWQCVALTALVTIVSRQNCVRRWGDFRGHLAFFGFFFVLLGLVPALLLEIGDPGRLVQVGLTPGRIRPGLTTLAAAAAVLALLLAVMMRDPSLDERFPLSRAAARMRGGFALYELVYVLGFYSAWEFTFRGLLFLPLVPAIGLVPALAIQTALSTLMHIDSPESEIWGALVGGVAFGLVAYLTGSILYPFLIHAGLGVAHDILRRRRLLSTG
uniref:CPBP family intramembrane metalloprotease n=1 Tax=candidate division WOR-3 bacterium TaxID=2052148 RepID=A0A7C4CBV9_UNCW3